MKVPAVFFLRVFLLLSIVDVTFCLLNGAVLYSFFILTFNILISYVISLLAKLFGHYCFIYKFVWYVIAFLMCCVDLFCVLNMNSRFGNGFASIIAGTNLSEAREFLSTFVNIDYVLILLAICLLFCFIPLTIKKSRLILVYGFYQLSGSFYFFLVYVVYFGLLKYGKSLFLGKCICFMNLLISRNYQIMRKSKNFSSKIMHNHLPSLLLLENLFPNLIVHCMDMRKIRILK